MHIYTHTHTRKHTENAYVCVDNLINRFDSISKEVFGFNNLCMRGDLNMSKSR